MAKKESVQIAGTEFYVISYAALVFGNNIVQYMIMEKIQVRMDRY